MHRKPKKLLLTVLYNFSCTVNASPILFFLAQFAFALYQLKNFGCAIFACALKFFICAPTSAKYHYTVCLKKA